MVSATEVKNKVICIVGLGYVGLPLSEEFSKHFRVIGFDVNEATVYPILTRLTNKGILRIEKRPSPFGPERKYYFITDLGKITLQEFDTTWQHIQSVVNQVMSGGQG